MWSSLVEYQRPATLAESLRLLSRQLPHTVPLAGGTWLVAKRDPQVEAVVDLSALNLSFVRQTARYIRLGAMTTLQELIESSFVQSLANGLLREAAHNSASGAIRNIATVGGTLVVGSPFSELCLALLVLDAQVIIHSPRAYSIPLQDLFTDRSTGVPNEGIITEIKIPLPKIRTGSSINKVCIASHAQPIVNAVALVSRAGHHCRLARLALGGVTDHPIRLPNIELMTLFKKIDTALCNRVAIAVANEIIHFHSSDYQREMAGVTVARALQEAWERTGEE